MRSSDVRQALIYAALLAGCHEPTRMKETAQAEASAPSTPELAPTVPTIRADPAAAQKALVRGRAFAAQAEWSKAEAQLTSAASSDPSDPVIAGELVWAALHARDVETARTAADASLALPSSGGLRAQLLFNAGLVAQARDLEADAARLYRESLTLRKNASVTAQLATIGVTTKRSLEPFVSTDCTSGTRAGIQRCLVAPGDGASIRDPKTALLEDIGSSFVIATVKGADDADGPHWCTNGETRLYRAFGATLVHVATLEPARCWNHATVTASVSFGSATERDVGKLKTAWIEWSVVSSFFSGPANSTSHASERFVTVCVLGARAHAPVCPFTHTLDTHVTSRRIDAKADDGPSSTDVVMSYRVDPSGDALHVSLLEGDATAGTVEQLGDFSI
jgi:hypothetical protein